MTDDVTGRSEAFADAAGEYSETEGRPPAGNAASVLEWLEPHDGWSVLDVTATGGETARLLSRHVALVTVAGLTPVATEQAGKDVARCSNVRCETTGPEALPFPDACFHAVSCRTALHHLPSPERFLSETVRVLKPGGRFVLVDDVAPDDAPQATLLNAFERLRDPAHTRSLPIPEWTHLLHTAGLRLLQSQRLRSHRDFAAWMSGAGADAARTESVEAAILGMPRFARAYFAVCSAGPRLLSFEVDRWMALAERPS